MKTIINGLFFAACLMFPDYSSAQSAQEIRLQAYQNYWQPLATRRFHQTVDLKMNALRNRAVTSGIAFPEILEIRTSKGLGSPASYLHRDLMIIPEEYLYQVISKSETLAILEPLLLVALFDGDPEYGLLMCYFELLVQYDSVQGAQRFLHCTDDQLKKIAEFRTESLNADRDEYFSTVYFFFDEAVEMMFAHEAAHFALDHLAPENEKVAHAQEYAADRHAKSLLDLSGVAGASAPLLIIALGQPGLLTSGEEIATAQLNSGFSTHPSPQCRAAYLTRESGGIAKVLGGALAEADEIAAFVPFINLALASLPDLDQMIDQLSCDTPD